MTGCVGSSADASGFTLGNAMVVPGTAQPGQTDQTPSPLPPRDDGTARPTAQTHRGTSPVAAGDATATPYRRPHHRHKSPPTGVGGASPARRPRHGANRRDGVKPVPVAAGTSGATPTSVTGTTGVVARRRDAQRDVRHSAVIDCRGRI